MSPWLHPPPLLPQIKLLERELQQLLLLPCKHLSERGVPILQGLWLGSEGALLPAPPDYPGLPGTPPDWLFSCPEIHPSALEGQAQELHCHITHRCPFCAWQMWARQKESESLGTGNSAYVAYSLSFFFSFRCHCCAVDLWTQVEVAYLLAHRKPLCVKYHACTPGKIPPCLAQFSLSPQGIWVTRSPFPTLEVE